MSSSFARNGLSVAAFLVAFIAVRYSVQAYRESRSAQRLDQSFNQMLNDATEARPDLSVPEALQAEASEQASRAISGEGDRSKRENKAADMFWGFYFVNVRARPDFCREQGEDIQPFVEAFEEAHSREFAKAKAIYERSKADENELYSGIKAQMEQTIRLDMSGIAEANQVSLGDACRLVADNAEELAQEMHLSKLQPAVHEALFQAR